MSETLTLNASGSNGCEPDQNPWTPTKGSAITIVNNTPAELLLTNVTPGLLTPAPGGTVTVPTSGWSGRVGQNNGTYQYEDGLLDAGVRDGTIDPS